MNAHEQLDHDFPTFEYTKVISRSTKAMYFEIKNVQVWLPISQIEDLDVVEKSFNIPRWLAIKNKLIEEELI